MSTATLPAAAGDYDDDRFAEIVDRYNDEPARQEPSRFVSRREAIDEGLGFRRHRTRERGQ